ncbi:MAG TPA: DUF1289 domain-containing protein [Burkholderiales bacterium]|nr:DUF1289 domain-containing protein [Burkholderiales bacterium]
MNSNLRDVPSPCINICQIDLDTNLCRGCLRNLDEIAGWLDYTIEEKLAVLARLEQRRSDIKLKP